MKPQPTLPFSSPEFLQAWTDWKTHRAEIRKPLTPTAANLQLRKLNKMTEAEAIAAIEHSINNGWQGIFDPPISFKDKKDSTPRPASMKLY